MDVKALLKRDWDDYCRFRPFEVSKYEWLSENVFDLTTYDNRLNDVFGRKVFEVCKAILGGTTFEYIQIDDAHYTTYILVCQILDMFHWIEWGTSIRGAWFEEQRDSRYILRDPEDLENVLPFTEENIRILLEFIEEESDEQIPEKAV